ncbi:MAG: tRNA (adenosine(37)-N6)-dimethylallyltransferase MiaA, partial [Verrucomicrobia bacterium]|nr:tRNA (adenosine(37)-N6)-dimethylallyltransferase MiaA [Verrucomicrobiota bacterium]
MGHCKEQSYCQDTDLETVYEKVAISVQEQFTAYLRHGSKRVIVIAGPTGVGKTALSLRLAERIGGEIISADSMQVYRGLDIGTAKATKEERERIPHHLIDIRDISEPFNVKDFHQEATLACQDILSRGKIPIVVGGTGFYIHAFLYGPPAGPGSDSLIREQLRIEEERFGIELLYDKLMLLDPIYGASICKNDKHKILRALEIIEISGKKVSDFAWKDREAVPFFDCRCWFIFMPRELLYQRLEKRCEEMLAQGLLDEVLRLDRAGVRNFRTVSQAIGYRQTLEFFDSAQTPDDYAVYIEKLKQASRHLAKRQFT